MGKLTELFGRSGLFRRATIDQVHEDMEENPHKMKRVLTRWDLVWLGVACMIGSGIFQTPGDIASHAGPGVILSYLWAGIASMLVAFCFRELAGLVNRSGSAYTYARLTLGELAAWIIGFDLVVGEYAIGTGAVSGAWSTHAQLLVSELTGYKLPEYLQHAPLHPEWGMIALLCGFAIAAGVGLWTSLPWGGRKFRPVVVALSMAALVPAYYFYGLANITSIDLPAMSILVLLSGMLMFGTKLSAKFTVYLVFVKMAVIAVLLSVGVFHFHPANLSDFLPHGIAPTFAGAVTAFFSYIGFDYLSTLPEESQNPKTDVPFAIVSSLTIVTVVYMATSAVLVGMMLWSMFSGPLLAAPFIAAIKFVHMDWLVPYIAVAIIVGLTTVLMTLLMGPSRILMNMARDGLVSKEFGRINPKRGTPIWALSAILVLVAIPAGIVPFDDLVNLTSIGTLFAFFMVAVGVMILRRLEPAHERRFGVPFAGRDFHINLGFRTVTIHGYDIIPGLAIVSCMVLMFNVAFAIWLRFIIVLAIGLIIYFSFGRKHSVLNRPNNEK
ncbi:MAG TPA: amino acid permease [Candidatus Obscuribacterales bacterium]